MSKAKHSQNDVMDLKIDGSIIEIFGEKLYKDKKKAGIIEPIQNAWDGDAQNVYINVLFDDIITIEDDGVGMNEEGIDKYTTIGGSPKKEKEITENYNRPIIGEFGVGKFATFGLGRQFIIETKRGDFERRVILNEDKLKKADGTLKVNYDDTVELDHDGTKLIINKLKDKGNEITANDVIKIIKKNCSELVTADNFTIYVNDNPIELEFPDGEWYSINKNHDEKNWNIEGEVLIADKGLDSSLRGIQQQHKGMTIENNMMGLYNYNHITVSHRIYGRVSANFLDITAGRDGFVEDSEKYKWFYNTTREKIKDILNQYRHDRKDEEIREDKEELKDILSDIKNIFEKKGFNIPEGEIKVSSGHIRRGKSSTSETDVTRETLEERQKRYEEKGEERGEYNKTHVSLPTSEKTMSEIIKDTGIAPEILALGEDESQVIYDTNPAAPTINMSHLLYKQAKNNDNMDFYFVRIISRIMCELNSDNISEAFEKHSDVCKDWVQSKEFNF